MHLNIDQWIAIAGVVVGLIGIGIAVWLYVKTIRSKVLAYAFTKPLPLSYSFAHITGDQPSGPEVRLFMLLWNKGTTPIEQSDFVKPITLVSSQPLSLTIYDKDGAAAGFITPADNSLIVSLLRPGEAIILQIDAMDENYKGDVSVEMKSADMSVFLRRSRGGLPDAVTGIVAVTSFVGMSAALGQSVDAENIPWWAWLLILLALFGCLVVIAILAAFANFVTRKLLYRSSSSVTVKFFEMQVKAKEAERSWTSFKTKLRTLLAS